MKIIRDKYKDIIDPSKLMSVSGETKTQMLVEKIKEELDELAETDYSDITEFGDVVEVLFAIAGLSGITSDEILKGMKRKSEKYGKFNDGLVLK